MPMVTPTATSMVAACGARNLHQGWPCCPHLVIEGCMHWNCWLDQVEFSKYPDDDVAHPKIQANRVATWVIKKSSRKIIARMCWALEASFCRSQHRSLLLSFLAKLVLGCLLLPLMDTLPCWVGPCGPFSTTTLSEHSTTQWIIKSYFMVKCFLQYGSVPPKDFQVKIFKSVDVAVLIACHFCKESSI